MESKCTLRHLIKTSALIPGDHLQSFRRVFNIPTEMVVTEPGIVAPKTGRIYYTGLYLRGTVAIDYDALSQLKDFYGTAWEREILLYEVWADLGSDGHVDYTLMGWMYLPENLDVNPLKIYNDTEKGRLLL